MQQRKPITKAKLMQYIPIKIRVDNMQDRLERLVNEQYIPAMKMGDGSKRSPGASDRMANATVRRMMYEEENRAAIDSGNAELDAMRAAINSLPNWLEREVLTLRYIDGDDNGTRMMRWANVAMKMYHQDDESKIKMAQRLHDRAILSLEELTR